MTVKELIRNLQQFDSELKVVIAADEEGESYSGIQEINVPADSVGYNWLIIKNGGVINRYRTLILWPAVVSYERKMKDA